MSELRIFSERGPSEAMERAWTNSGSLCSVECLCGRVHFIGRGASHGDYEKGELEELEASARKDPQHYFEINTYDSIDVGHLDGKVLVLGCPCNFLTRYEEFLAAHRWQILRYFKNVAEEASRAAAEASEISAGLALAVEAAEMEKESAVRGAS